MWSTGESVTEAVANRKGDRSAAAAGFASAPKEVWRIGLTQASALQTVRPQLRWPFEC